jgi:nucleotide-binding universal stress UspA family protein
MKVLIAVDGSPVSRRAVDFARGLLSGRRASIVLLHVISEHLIAGKGGVVPAEVYDMPRERATSNALLNEVAQRLRDGGDFASIEQQLAVGDPADRILSAATEDEVDLIVMGSRGLNAASRFFLGSVSTRVATHTRRSILIVHPDA